MSAESQDRPFTQPASFAFTEANLEEAKHIIAKYPAGRQASAVLPLLYLAQRQHDNWVPEAAMNEIARMLEMAPIRVYEVATFYTMFNLKPVGKFFLQICRTTPCWLRGNDSIYEACKSKLGLEVGGMTEDGKFSLGEVECLGACVNGPVLQVNDDYYEDLDKARTEALLDALSRGEVPKHGTTIDRINAAPVGGPQTLNSLKFEGDGDVA